MSLKIIKRGGESVPFNPQKIYNRVKRASKGLNVNSDEIFIKVITCDSLVIIFLICFVSFYPICSIAT